MYSKQIAAVGLVAGSVIWASAAEAATISIGAGVNGGPITNIGSRESALSTTFSNFNGWSSNIVSGAAPTLGTANQAPVPGTFTSTSVNQIVSTAQATNNVLDVYVTASNLGAPVGNNVPLSTDFTVSVLPTGWTMSESAFVNTDNAVFGMETPISSSPQTFFSAAGTRTFSDTANLTSPFSLTELFVINSKGNVGGFSNGAISISTVGGFSEVPIPGALPLFASGLISLWGWTRRRKATAKPTA